MHETGDHSPGEDGSRVAERPALPGCVSQGESREAAIANIREGRDDPFAQPVVPKQRQLDRSTLRAILRQVGLTVEELNALLSL